MTASARVYEEIYDEDEDEAPAEMGARIAAAVRFLQHEARVSGLGELAAALRAAERVAVGPVLSLVPAPVPEAPVPEVAESSAVERLCEVLSLAGSDGEQAFRLRALAELSAGLSFDQLMRLAYLAECNPPHLGSLITMLTEDVGALPQG